MPFIYSQLYCTQISTPQNVSSTITTSLHIFTQFPCGSYYLNKVHASGRRVRHVLAVNIACLCIQALSSSSIIGCITDNSRNIVKVCKINIMNAIAQGSIFDIFSSFPETRDFLVSLILKMFPRIDKNALYERAHQLVFMRTQNRVTRSNTKEFSSLCTTRLTSNKDTHHPRGKARITKHKRNVILTLLQRRFSTTLASYSKNNSESAIIAYISSHSNPTQIPSHSSCQ